MSNTDEQIQYNCYLIFGQEGAGKTSFIKKMSGKGFERNILITDDGFTDDLGISENQEHQQSDLIQEQEKGQGIQKYSSVEDNKIYYEINLHEDNGIFYSEETQKQDILNIIDLIINLKESRLKIIFVCQFQKKNIKQTLKNINMFFQGIIANEQFWSAYSNYFELVFTKVWDHNIQSLKQYFDQSKYLEEFQINKRTNYFKKDGEIIYSQTFQNMNLLSNFNFFLISNFLDLNDGYLQYNFLNQQEDSQILIENYKIIRSSLKENQTNKKLLRYLRFLCSKAKQSCYQYNFRECEEFLSYINNHEEDLKLDENLFYQYQDTNHFYKFMKNQLQNEMMYNGAPLQNVIIDENELETTAFQNQLVSNLNNTIMELKEENRFLRKKTEINQKLSEQNNLVIENLQLRIEELLKQNMEKNEQIEKNDNQTQIKELKEMILQVQQKNDQITQKDPKKNSQQNSSHMDTIVSHQASELSVLDTKDNKNLKIFKSIDEKNIQEFKNLLHKKKKFYILTRGDQTIFQAVEESKNKEMIQILQNRIKEYIKINIVECGLKNHLPKMRALLFSGVKVDFQDFQGRTALMTATKKGDPITLEFLIQAGADINMKDNDGFTPLIWSINYSNLKSLNFLIEFEADVNVKTNSGMTALMWASNFGNIHMVKQLVKSKADIFAEDNNHRTALSLAQKKNHVQVVNYLQQQIDKYPKKKKEVIQNL